MGCLALNASYEPLTILPVERALRLVFDRKAEVLEADDRRIYRSAKERVAAPLVIRLKRFVHVPRKFRRQVTNTFLFARDGYRCMYCGRTKTQLRGREFLTRDHVLPISRGGLNTWDNVATACSGCNNRKASHLPEECGMHLMQTPSEPNYVELVWAVRRVTRVQAKYIGMFYGDEVLDALIRHADDEHEPKGLATEHEPVRHLALVS
jgi:5-methylcytosine-specific restriction endonuclease McrA